MINRRLFLIGSSAVASALAIGTYTVYKKENKIEISKLSFLPFVKKAYAATQSEVSVPSGIHVSSTEQNHNASALNYRFQAFATVEFNGEFYMTPKDFLNSLAFQKPNYLPYKRRLEIADVRNMLSTTPRKWRSSPNFFRNLDKKGLICYSEYLFLLALLTKPISGFQIAFNLFDTDGSREIDLVEFLVINRVISDITSVNNEFSEKLRPKSLMRRKDDVVEIDVQVVMSEEPTTLLSHFFGPKGRDKLSYQDFARFVENLQTEVLDIEFQCHALGFASISEADFARILLKYSKIKKAKHDTLVNHVTESIKTPRGIKFEEFKKFFQFLNSLDDFATAMKFFSLADQSITKQEFQQAVHACVNYRLSEAVVDTLFLVFPAKGEKRGLNYKAFVMSMKDRLSRGIVDIQTQEVSNWRVFRHCLKETMRGHDD